MRSFAEDLAASLAHIKVQLRHRINTMAANLLGKSSLEG